MKITSGPNSDPTRSINVGVAAHVTAASAGGPRFDASLTPEERSSIQNALWLCQKCGALVDRDPDRFSAALLREWRSRAEDAAAKDIGAGSRYRRIAATEIHRDLSDGEYAALKALEEEFGCHIEAPVSIPTGGGLLNLSGAVVRGEDLIALDIRECHEESPTIAYFQIEHLVELGSTLAFDRFKRFVLFVVVVSDAPEESDAEVCRRLESLQGSAPCEIHIRIFRLNTLRAKYNL
jgi:hypothetical protein